MGNRQFAQVLTDHAVRFGGVRQKADELVVLIEDDDKEWTDHRLLAGNVEAARMGV